MLVGVGWCVCVLVCWLVSDDPSTQNHGGVQKRALLPPEPSKVRPCHAFAALETKSDDSSTQNRGGPKARAHSLCVTNLTRNCFNSRPPGDHEVEVLQGTANARPESMVMEGLRPGRSQGSACTDFSVAATNSTSPG